MNEELQDRFSESLLEVAAECRRVGYPPNDFERMVKSQGGVATVRDLLGKAKVSTGFTELFLRSRLDLTMEAQILRIEWRTLFTAAEREIARRRLAECRFVAPWDIPEDATPLPDDLEEMVDEDGPDESASDIASGRMFGIKLIYPDHLRFPHLCGLFAPGDGLTALMNFKNSPRNAKRAASIPIGHKALVFTRQHAVWAIEFTGSIDDGSLLAAHGVAPDWPSKEWTVHRPIRFLARMNVDEQTYERGMHRHDVVRLSGVDKRSFGAGHYYISEDEFNRMFKAIPWDWVASESILDSGVTLPDELPPGTYPEGAPLQLIVNGYERSPDARRQCIQHWGHSCVACGVAMGERYGPLAEGLIHVHHLTPLAAIGEEYQVDPIADLRPVCPNCHAVMHCENPPLTVERVRELLASHQPSGAETVPVTRCADTASEA